MGIDQPAGNAIACFVSFRSVDTPFELIPRCTSRSAGDQSFLRSIGGILRAALFLWWAPLLAFSAGTLPGATTNKAASVSHWAFQPPKTVRVPNLRKAGRAENPIDAFLRVRQEELELTPVAPAGKTELLRRVTYDLTGLPPTPTELADFLRDNTPDAYEKVVDRLLASPGFGERWAQHWLDLAHYADSNGFELDADRPDAWRYRDWVVQAFNDDLPYDRFVTLQIAGDEAAPGDPAALVAAGFARCGPREVVGGNIDPEVRRQDELTAATATVGSVFLGLTLGCARCHDHKFDPLPATDYYGLQAFFAGTELKEIPLFSEAQKKEFEAATAGIQARIKPLEAAKSKLEEPYRTKLLKVKESRLTDREREIRALPKERRTPEEERLLEGIGVALRVTWEEVAEAVAESPVDHPTRESLKRQIHELQLQLPRPLAHAMSMTETEASMPETRVLKRGSVKNKLGPVSPAPPAVLLAGMKEAPHFVPPAAPLGPTHSGRRLALARWLTATNNPLTARVIVNRLWQHHFGRGLVGTTSDFGTRGERPSHPELLDWLAGELLQNGWHLKPLHRLMVTTQAYRRASRVETSSGLARDPDNRYLWRMNPRRMEAEGFRDAVLAVAGILQRKPGGPGVSLPLELEVRSLIFTEAEVVDLWPVSPDVTEHFRRSIYVLRKRNVHYPMFDAFDVPDSLTPCPQRPVSTHAPQALVMLNGEFAQQAARAFGDSLCRGAATTPARIREAFLRCYARPPSVEEMRITEDFMAQGPAAPERERWTDFTLALINSNEFVYVP